MPISRPSSTNAEQAALLQRVHAHLHDEGLFAFETRNPLLPGVKTRAGGFVPLETRPEEHGWSSYINVDGHVVRVSTTQVYDHSAQVVHLTGYERWHDGSREQARITRTALRYTFPQELAALLHANGFTCLRRYGDWDKTPLAIDSPSIIVVCKKA